MRRLILFDIDGTLVRGGPAKDAFETAMIATYGTVGDVGAVSFGGKTDPQIARELLTSVGFDRQSIEAGFPELWVRYVGRLEELLEDRPMKVLPGVEELLDALAELEDVGIGLLTGNILRGAELKLRSAGLWEWFAVGSFGSDREERDELPSVALERARLHWSVRIEPAEAIVVGDTPRDVGCGRAGGTRTVAVATGTFPAAALVEAGADHVLPDLSSTRDVVALLTA
ncbi:MAG: HAD hydrolase-like protein [Gemmatimonadota bacterium]|nr:HAD hydrolase-like protein [Gemmatimonadota bacterium]